VPDVIALPFHVNLQKMFFTRVLFTQALYKYSLCHIPSLKQTTLTWLSDGIGYSLLLQILSPAMRTCIVCVTNVCSYMYLVLPQALLVVMSSRATESCSSRRQTDSSTPAHSIYFPPAILTSQMLAVCDVINCENISHLLQH
jgi:hypothetical protein